MAEYKIMTHLHLLTIHVHILSIPRKLKYVFSKEYGFVSELALFLSKSKVEEIKLYL